jgi:hypothetical protein
MKRPALITRVGESELEARARADWRVQAVNATLPATGLGMMLRAVIGTGRGWLPRLGLAAQIGEDGVVRCNFWDQNGFFIEADNLPLTAPEIRDSFRRLADQLKLSDADRLDMFTRLAKWLGDDRRSRKDAKEIGL